jgi:hypothetical protein
MTKQKGLAFRSARPFVVNVETIEERVAVEPAAKLLASALLTAEPRALSPPRSLPDNSDRKA